MKIRAALPALNEVGDWLNSQPLQREDLLGGWTLIYFWSISCPSCVQQFEELRPILEQYKQLQWISIHMPRLEEDKDVKRVKRYVRRQKRTEPIVLDQELLLTKRFGAHFVPSFYLFDEAGLLRYYQAGNRSLRFLTQRLERLTSFSRNFPTQ